jgi:hypothetical protein
VIGLDILIGHRTAAGSIVSAVLALLVVGGVIWLLIARPNLNIPGLSLNFGGELKQQSVSWPLGDIRSADAEISFATGQNQLAALSDSSKLIEGDIRHYGELEFDVNESGSQADIRVGTRGSVNVGFSSSERWDIGLNPRVTYDLVVNMGAGEAKLDLSKLSLTGGQINAGVGSAEVSLPSSGHFTLRINGGVGSVSILAPREVEMRVEVNTGLGSFSAGSRLRETSENTYETERFGSSDNAITLDIEVGVGSVTVQDR